MKSRGLQFTGLRAWWVQRLSALCMLAFVIFLLATFALDPMHTYTQWHGWIGRPVITAALATFFAALLLHMWVGLRDALLDYAKPPTLQRTLLAVVACGLLGIALSVVWILVSISH